MNFCKAADLISVRDGYKKGDRVAGHILGYYYQVGVYVEKDEKRASSIFVDLAGKGHWGSRGVCHEYGYDPYEKSIEKAVECYRKGVEEGDEVSICNLGVCFDRGTGVDKNEKKAASLFCQAAKKGYAVAIRNLGYCYLNGAGVEVDKKKAVQLYSQAADKGLALAINSLGACYGKGDGVEKDEEKAIDMYKKAADLGIATALNNLKCRGIDYTPCPPKQEQQQQQEEEKEEEEVKVSSLFESCTSDVDLFKMEDRLFLSPPPPAHIGEEGKGGKGTRHAADALLRSLDSRGVGGASSSDKHPSEKEGLDSAVANLLTVAAGVTSTVTSMHDRVQSAIDTLSHQLPDLKKASKQRQAVLEAMRGVEERDEGRGGGGGAARQTTEGDLSPLDRASTLSRLLQPDCIESQSSVRVLRKMRERLSESISKMKADISEVEENARREHERERKHEFDSAAYLISMSKQYAEMSKVALPHLLTMSDHLGVDLLHLSGSALSTVFDMKELSSLKSEYEAALGMLRRCKSHIENKEKGEEALAIRCPSGLASLLTGRVPSGIDERPANVTLFDITSHFARLPSSSVCSGWHSSLTEVWSWLECKYSEWSDVESRCDHALSHSDDVAELGRVMKEVKGSGMDVGDRLSALTEKVSSLMLDD